MIIRYLCYEHEEKNTLSHVQISQNKTVWETIGRKRKTVSETTLPLSFLPQIFLSRPQTPGVLRDALPGYQTYLSK